MPILPVLQMLAAARILLHTQIVVCPGWNDGDHLQQTITDLVALYPAVQSIAVVPVGLTRHRQRLPQLQLVTDQYAAQFLDTWQEFAANLSRKLGEPMLYLADEWFVKADRPFPPLATYGDLPQLENGVGMIPLFLAESAQVLATAAALQPRRYIVITGVSFARFLTDYCHDLTARTGVELEVVGVPNRLFGESVTVTGLVAGKDIIAALVGRELGDGVLVPDVMLKEGAGVFLDDLTVTDIASALGVPVMVTEATPAGLYALLKGEASSGE
jgi:putative radical SAM enzyme (TIGR03279 family)